jgi:RNA polymerase sigma-70 factor (ECF subfamily)
MRPTLAAATDAGTLDLLRWDAPARAGRAAAIAPEGAPSDEALCRRVAEQDEAAFDLLVTRYQERAYRIAWSILRSAPDAQDVSQEAFVRLFQAARRFDGRSRFSTWFYRVLVNLCLDHQRRGRWWRRILGHAPAAVDGGVPLVEAWPAPVEDPGDRLDREAARRRLWAAVDRLPPRQRAALILQAHEGLPTAEIAAVLGCSEATVRVHIHRGLRALRRRLAPERPG